MNILHLRSTNFYGGPERQIHQHALHANKSIYVIHVGSFAENKSEPDLLKIARSSGLKTALFNVFSAYDPRMILFLIKYIRKENINLLCSHEYRSSFWCLLAKLITGVPWCALSRGRTFENNKVSTFIYFETILLRFADVIVAVSNGQKRYIMSKGIKNETIKVIENAVDPILFKNVMPVDIRTIYSFPEESFICISGGRFSKEKGQGYLIQAAKELIKKNKNIRFILFGDGPDYNEIKNKILNDNLSYYIKCPGFEKNIIGYIKGADLLVNPSLSEGLPNIVLESMAVRTPVVATAVGGVPDLIIDGISGFLTEPGNVSELERSIQRAISSDRKKITESGYQYIIENYSFEHQFELYCSLYNSFLDRKS